MSWLRGGFVGISGIVFCLLLVLPPFEGLTREAQNGLAIFQLCLALWVTLLLPLAITGLLSIGLLTLLQVMPSGEVFAFFGNRAVFFILGVFILAAAMMQSGLSKRMALFFLRFFKASPNILILGILTTCAFLAFWMPEHAVAAMMFPIVAEIARSLKLKPLHSSFGKAIFLSLAWGSVIGGVATFLGGARNPLAIGMLKEGYDLNIGFINWMVAVVPLVIILLAMAYGVIRLYYKFDVEKVGEAGSALSKEVGHLGKMTSREKRIGIIALLTILAWICLSDRIGLASIAIISAVSLFVFRAVNWKDIEGYVNWGIVLMYGGAIALGSALANTGAAKWMATQLLTPFWGTDPYILLGIIALVMILLTEGISNVASVAVMLPVAFGFAEAMGINPIIMVYVVAVPAGLAYCLPISTPPMAIAFSAGYYRITDALKGGIILNVISLIFFLLIIKFYWPMIGLRP